MRIALALVALLIGSLTLAGQLISVANFSLAQRLGLQERDEHADPLFSRLELNTAWWDVAVLWTLVSAAILMLVEHAWWPWVALVAGGIHLDTGGREIVKNVGLRAHGIRVGSSQEARLALVYLGVLSGIGATLVGYALSVLA